MPQVGSDVSQEVDAGGVGPMEVLENDEGWAVGGELSKELPHLREERGLVGDAASRPPAKAAGGAGRPGSRRHSSKRSSQGPYGGVLLRS